MHEKCPNTEFFLVRIQSKCGKMQTRKKDQTLFTKQILLLKKPVLKFHADINKLINCISHWLH